MTIKVIPEGSEEYRRWEMPRVDERLSGEAQLKLTHGRVTADQLSNIQEQAHKEAFEQGFTQGYKDGIDKAQKETAQKNHDLHRRVQQMDQLLRTLSTPFEQLDGQVEAELASLAVSLARQIIRRELKLNPGEIVAVVREAVAALPVATRHPQIFLHPEDAAFIRQTFSLSGEHEHWKLIDDPAMTRGDCRVVTETSRIDASVE
ncbi:MAG: flagellar assembly protein FliH, partial [Gammaproteobacteria bacterium]|nr:flagellar assembly protein FliH [Gammaproteobacteria bacterium]